MNIKVSSAKSQKAIMQILNGYIRARRKKSEGIYKSVAIALCSTPSSSTSQGERRIYDTSIRTLLTRKTSWKGSYRIHLTLHIDLQFLHERKVEYSRLRDISSGAQPKPRSPIYNRAVEISLTTKNEDRHCLMTASKANMCTRYLYEMYRDVNVKTSFF